MNWLLLLACLCFAGCQAAEISAGIKTNSIDKQEKDKGFVEWIANLFGGGTTTTVATPIVHDPEPPKECPACHCGIAHTKRRIVGGYETKVRQYTWMVMLLYNGRMFCGGSLINDFYVMTAAHCTGFRKERMTVRFLEHDIGDRINDTKTIDRKVSRIIRHQRYNPGTYDNDIALIRLDERLDLSNAIKKRARNEEGETTTEVQVATEAEATTSSPTPNPEEDDDPKVRPVCLPPSRLSFTGDCAFVIGWGVTEQGGSLADKLQEVKVPIVSNKECRDRSYGRRVTENMLCAGEPQGGRDACQGDSGGPLLIFNETSQRYHEVGVVSWGEGCAQPNKYGVYSRVNRYLTWIQSNTKDACYCDGSS